MRAESPAPSVNDEGATKRGSKGVHPDRLDLDGSRPLIPSLWRETAQGLWSHLRHGGPEVPAGARLAPIPSGGDPLLGHLREARTDPLRYFPQWRAEAGDVARLRFAGVTAHLISHPDHVRFIMQEGNRRFEKPLQGRENLAQILGNGLLVAEGDFWLRQRRIAQPAFHKKRISGFAERMVDVAEALGDDWGRRAGPFDVARDMMRVTLEIVQLTLLGASSSKSEADAIGDAVSVVLEEINTRFNRLINPPANLPVIGNREFVRSVELLDRIVGRMITERREGGPGDDLLSMLLEARDEETGEGMDDRQLRDEVMTIFLAGHETTANALSWTYYLLGKHPHAARRMHAEIDEVLVDRRPTLEDLRSLPYTRAVFEEAMRLYPPAWIVARSPIQDETLDGFHLPAQSRLFMSPYVLHRHPDFWEDPEGFDPERFLGERRAKQHKFAYMPFGGGPRFCIGQSFAMMEGVLVLASLSRRFHLSLTPGHPVVPEALVTLRPKHGIQVVARPRC